MRGREGVVNSIGVVFLGSSYEATIRKGIFKGKVKRFGCRGKKFYFFN